MSVVLRCRSCGTIQATPGECDACHEAQVGYFCTNHEPGVWLTGPTCPQCERRVMPVAPPPPARPRPRAPVSVREEPAREEVRLDLRPAPSPLWKVLSGALLAPRAAEPAPERGWLGRLVLRLALIGLVGIALLALVVYWIFRSL